MGSEMCIRDSSYGQKNDKNEREKMWGSNFFLLFLLSFSFSFSLSMSLSMSCWTSDLTSNFDFRFVNGFTALDILAQNQLLIEPKVIQNVITTQSPFVHLLASSLNYQ